MALRGFFQLHLSNISIKMQTRIKNIVQLLFNTNENKMLYARTQRGHIQQTVYGMNTIPNHMNDKNHFDSC